MRSSCGMSCPAMSELTPSIETEWQFDAVHLAPVQRWLGQHAEGTIRVEPAGTRSLVDTYLDTSDLRISRAQRSLRLRRVGRETEITLKTHAPAVAGVRSREEITERVSVPDVAALGTDGEVGWRVRALIGRRQLTELFEVRTRRQVFLLQHGALPAGEVVLDRTVIGIGPRLEPARLRRVEVEVADATNPEIAAFVERLRQECGLQLATHTKFEAGFLARGLEVPLARDLGSTSFDLHSSTGELAFAVLRGHFVEMLAHESGTRLGEDPEELHGMRVATRRLRAVLGIFEPALPVRASRFRADLRWLGQVLGAVRDLDVGIGQLREGTDEGVGGEDAGALDALIVVLESRRSDARAVLLEALDSRRYDRLVDGFAAFLAHGPLRRSAASTAPATATVPAIAIERYRKVRKQGRRLDASSEPGEFHVLRIRCKRTAVRARSGCGALRQTRSRDEPASDRGPGRTRVPSGRHRREPAAQDAGDRGWARPPARHGVRDGRVDRSVHGSGRTAEVRIPSAVPQARRAVEGASSGDGGRGTRDPLDPNTERSISCPANRGGDGSGQGRRVRTTSSSGRSRSTETIAPSFEAMS